MTIIKKKNFTLVLNMIVLNEAHVIEKTLNNLCSKIDFDYWVICDTGSTDNTKEIIKNFFNNKNIKGELHEDKWIDFGHNRTLALERAYNKTDFLLVFDADDEIIGDIIFPDNIFENDSYFFKFICNNSIYSRVVLINNRNKWIYKGVLHEYLECLENNKSSYINGNNYINIDYKGNRSKDNNKYQKDALILEYAYEVALQQNDYIYMRYSFYCANSYRDAKDKINAIKWYKNTLTLNNWTQEKYICCLRLSELYDDENIEEKIYYLIESFKYDNTRVEGIYNLIKHYCIEKQNKIAFIFYELIQDYYENIYLNDNFNNKLFIYENNYSFYLPYYMIIVCEILKKYDIGLKMYEIIFHKKNINIEEWWINNLVYNLQFFIEFNKDISFVENWKEYLSLLIEKNFNINEDLIKKYEIYNQSLLLNNI